MTYLTYAEYKEIGGTLEETAFNRNIDRSCGIIDNATHNRIEAMKKVPQNVKSLCRDLVEYFAANFGSSKQVSSRNQSAGGVSESESFVIRSIEERAGEIDDMVKDYLLNEVDDCGTPLLYRGAMR
jgi:methyltransferase-like protein